jgi:hypothetical protein
MTPTKLLIGQILVVFLIMILGVWGATQWAAAMLGYQSELGTPWYRIGHFIIYRPWDLFGWWYHFDAYAPEVFDKAGACSPGSWRQTGRSCGGVAAGIECGAYLIPNHRPLDSQSSGVLFPIIMYRAPHV